MCINNLPDSMDAPPELYEEDEDINELKNLKKIKKNQNKIDDGVVIDSSSTKRSIKGIMLSVTKPSYTLKRGIGHDLRSLRCEHRNRLRYVLRQLVRRQNWDEVSGVLSVLLKGTHKEISLSSNRSKYWATLETLKHMGVAKLKPRKIQQVFDIWMKKNFAITKNRRSVKGRFDVQLEFLLFCISQGDSDGAYQGVISLLQENEFTKDSIGNLVTGLAFSYLWHNSIQKEIDINDSPESFSDFSQSKSKSTMVGPEPIRSIGQSNGPGAVEFQDSDSSLQKDSNTSVRIGKSFDLEEVVGPTDKQVSMEIDGQKKEISEIDGISGESDLSGNVSRFRFTGKKKFGSIFYVRDIESLLMPLRFPNINNLEDFVSFQRRIHNDHYKSAIKHLRDALQSSTPAFEALLPLIHMLLLGDQVKEAIEEVERVVQVSNATLPFRLKASLLEHFSREDGNKMCICFEDTLKKDPTCSHSMAKLISFHYDGYYSSEKLVEMIGLHLDATFAEGHIWKEFAYCFIRLSQCDEDRMSSCMDTSDICYKSNSKMTPESIFKDKVSRENWRLRCRWWKNRHFTQTLLVSEVSSGNMELVTYKAALACHFYGPKYPYVVKACTYLEKEKNGEMSFLKMHMKNAIGLYTT